VTPRADIDAMTNLIEAPAAPPERATMTVPEAAMLLGLSESATYEAVTRGEIPAVKIGRRVLILRDRLIALLHD
jgi:excisionase family DNA binding protein